MDGDGDGGGVTGLAGGGGGHYGVGMSASDGCTSDLGNQGSAYARNDASALTMGGGGAGGSDGAGGKGGGSEHG